MSISLGINQRMALTQTLAPRMIHSMEVLQLSIMALQERIEQELNENPVLELADGHEELPADEAPVPEEREPNTDGELVIDESGELDFNRLDALNKEWEDSFNEEHRPSRNGLDEEGDKKHDAMQNMTARPQSLHDYLTEQLTFMELDDLQGQLVRYLISHIDESGKLAISLEEAERDFRPAVTLDEVEEALSVVQKLDPPGVGFRDLKECLLLQVSPDLEHADLVRVLVEDHLDDIRHNRMPVIQRKTGKSLAVIAEAIEELKRLDPKPGARFAADSTQYVTPDIIVERNEDGDYDVRLANDWAPSLRISGAYVALAKTRDLDPKTKKFLREKLQSAEWLKESIEQRRNTLERVTRAIIEHQRAFLESGPEFIEPLKMQQIADRVGVHVTTVSRAVDDKWVQTPRGVFPLKRFFGGGKVVSEESGEEVAWETIRAKLLELIDSEDKSNPLSDEDLVTKLQEANFPVARRTVTKYRKMLSIPSSRQRKQWV